MTQHTRHASLPTWIHLRFLSIAAGVVVTNIAASALANASPVQWTFSGASATFSYPYPVGTDDITGGFVFDAATDYQSDASITLTGPVFPGTYTLLAPSLDSCLCLATVDLGPDYVGIVFGELFTSSSPVPLQDITIYDTATSSTVAYSSLTFGAGYVTGVVVPTPVATPEPTNLALLLCGALGLFLVTMRCRASAQTPPARLSSWR